MAGVISDNRTEHGIPHTVSCRVLGVSGSWFHKWRDRRPTRRAVRRQQPADEIGEIFAGSGGTYGSPKIFVLLVRRGWRVSVNTVVKLMAERGLVARVVRRRSGLTRPGKRPAAPDFVKRDFTADEPDLVWAGDMTEIVTEAFNSVLKVEYVHRHTFRTCAEARIRIATWITDFRNTRRLHSVCEFKSPIDYENEDRAGPTVGPAAQEGLHSSRRLTGLRSDHQHARPGHHPRRRVPGHDRRRHKPLRHRRPPRRSRGVAPVPRDSGKISGSLHRPRRHNRRLQRVFCISALFSIRHCEDSRRFYERKRAEGKRHIQAVLALARRRVNVLWALLRDGRSYEAVPPTAQAAWQSA